MYIHAYAQHTVCRLWGSGVRRRPKILQREREKREGEEERAGEHE